MTNQRTAFPHRVCKFEPDGDAWDAIERGSELGPLTAEQRADITSVAQVYLWAAGEHYRGVSAEMARKHDVVEFPHAPLPNESFGLFVDGLHALYEEMTGRKAAVRNDGFGSTQFVRFVLAVWKALPAYNRKSNSESAMSSRIAAHFRNARRARVDG